MVRGSYTSFGAWLSARGAASFNHNRPLEIWQYHTGCCTPLTASQIQSSCDSPRELSETRATTRSCSHTGLASVDIVPVLFIAIKRSTESCKVLLHIKHSQAKAAITSVHAKMPGPDLNAGDAALPSFVPRML
nr:hypothetical protein CFP56_20350 [Quercus suber]